MKLHWSPRSPFVRKVMIVLHEKHLLERVSCERSLVMMSAPANPDVLADNPLGKIPTLVLDDGTALFDSRVIAEYLDSLGEQPRLIPQDFTRRIACLRWQALGDGFTDILLLWRTERSRGEAENATISANLEAKVRATLARLEREAGQLATEEFGLGHISVACALGQLDFRYAKCGWKQAHPDLAAWHAKISRRPSLAATAIKDDGGAVMGDVEMPLRFGEAA